MIDVIFEHCSVMQPKRFDNQAEYRLRCVMEDGAEEDEQIFLSNEVANAVNNIINFDIVRIKNLEEMINLTDDCINANNEGKKHSMMDSIKSLIKLIHDEEPQTLSDILTVISCILQSKLSCVNGEYIRLFDSMMQKEMIEVINSPSETASPVEHDSEVETFLKNLLPNGAEIVDGTAGTYEVDTNSIKPEYVEEDLPEEDTLDNETVGIEQEDDTEEE